MSAAPHLVLFARGVIAILNAWPALRLAVQESWGGPHSAEKRIWLASNLVDAFEKEPLDEEQIEDLLLEAMIDEFEAEIDDDSPRGIAKKIVNVWKVACDGNTEDIVKLEAATDQLVRRQLSTTQQTGNGDDEWIDEEGSEEGDDFRNAPELISPPTLEEMQVVVDDEGFQLVQKGAKRKGHR